MEIISPAPHIYQLRQFFTADECREHIALSEAASFSGATVQTGSGQRRVEQVRNNDRAIIFNTAMAQSLWKRLAAFAPEKIGNSVATGLNEMFRYYRYGPGQQFRWHRDMSFIRNESEASYYTFMVYLNDDFEGGETKFVQLDIKPEAGTALIFLHSLTHNGEAVTAGTKYVLRTDIMYQLKSPAG